MLSVTVQVPATTSNFGPGFDCLGCALQVYNRVTVTKRRRRAPTSAGHAMAEAAAAAFFDAVGGGEHAAFPFDWKIAGEVPMSRGLGSSVTLRLGLIAGLNALAGEPLTRERVFALCATLEGHPDNAAPAAFGGFTVAGGAGAVPRFAVSARLKFVLLVPAFEIRTDEARRLLPARIGRKTAVASSARACRLTAAFASGQYALLGDEAIFDDDAFHQAHRLPLIPFLPEVIRAGKAAGALGGFLSGSGSTVACLTLRNAAAVAAAMRAGAESAGASVEQMLTVSADNQGARIISRQRAR